MGERSVQKGHIPPITYKLIAIRGHVDTTYSLPKVMSSLKEQRTQFKPLF